MIIQFLFIYLIVWWLCFFAVLPIGMKREEKPEEGHDAGAPKHPMLRKKILLTSIVTLIITIVLMYLLSLGIMDQFRV